jgi:hypothetical protein
MVHMGPRSSLGGIQSTDDGSLWVRSFKRKTHMITDVVAADVMTDVKIDAKVDVKDDG